MFSQNDEVSQLINEVLASQSQKSFSQHSQPQPIVYSQNTLSSLSQDKDFKNDLDEKSINTILAKSSIFSKVTKACEPAPLTSHEIPNLTPIKRVSSSFLKPQTEQLDLQLIKLNQILKSFELCKSNENKTLNELKDAVKGNLDRLLLIEKQLNIKEQQKIPSTNNIKEIEFLKTIEFVKKEIKEIKSKLKEEGKINDKRHNTIMNKIDKVYEFKVECMSDKNNNELKTRSKRKKQNKKDNECLKEVTNYKNNQKERKEEKELKKLFSKSNKVDIDLTLHSDDVNGLKISSKRNIKEIEIKEINKDRINSFEKKVLRKYKDKVKERNELDVYSFIGSL
eukprot:GAHX01002775.1.p1 GENE.GAHX01002775.1~~GAHX01002775.1.p1  ORF type:complete len:338 (+),score=94.65 GAHX01002775.1:174-1187(+)